MTEQEEREHLKTKALSDIEYIKKQSENIQTLVRIHIGGIESIAKVDSVLSSIETIQPTFFDTGTLENAQIFVTNYIGRFTKAVRAFNKDYLSKNTQTELLEAAEAYISAVNSIDTALTEQDVEKSEPATQKNLMQLLEEINNKTPNNKSTVSLQKKISALENQIKSLQETNENTNILKEINEIKNSITDLQSSESQIEITKTVTQARQLFDKAKNSQELFNGEIQKLISAKERQIAYTLSEQFSAKCDKLSREVNQNLNALTISLILFLAWNSLLFLGFYTKWFNIEYWQFIIFKITLNIPFALYLGITFNEYSKSKKLYEEYEHKRIMAATLVNNLERLKNELHADEKDLLELIKVPFEKIFDNPVHSIYGDKSGDKNIGLDQLEKITSIIEKMKK